MEVHKFDGFQVDTPTAAGALLAPGVGPGLGQAVAKGLEALDVFHLGDALAVRLVVAAPVGQPVHVEIGSVEAEARQRNSRIDGERTLSALCSRKCVSSRPAVRCKRPSWRQFTRAFHWPDQPTATMYDALAVWTLKKGKSRFDERPPPRASFAMSPWPGAPAWARNP